MLGETQWRWFENELRNSDAQIHIIGSSVQVLLKVFFQMLAFEVSFQLVSTGLGIFLINYIYRWCPISQR